MILFVCNFAGKIACTKDKLFNSGNGVSGVSSNGRSGSPNKKNIHALDINESISLVVTLYKDNAKTNANNNGLIEYQEKIGKIILRQFKRSTAHSKSNQSVNHANSSTYFGLGSFKLNLHNMVNDILVNGRKDFIWKLDGIDDVSCYSRMSVRMLKHKEDMDDVMSIISDQSDFSVVAASFEKENVIRQVYSVSGSDQSLKDRGGHDSHSNSNSSLDKMESTVNDNHTKEASTTVALPQPLPLDSIPEQGGHGRSLESSPETIRHKPQSQSHVRSRPNTDNDNDDYNKENDADVDMEHDNSSPSTPTAGAGAEESHKNNKLQGKRFPFLSAAAGTVSAGSHGAPSSSSIPYHLGLKNKTTRTPSEILELQTEVSHLRRLLHSKDEEINSLKTNLTSRECEYKNQYLVMKTDLNVAQDELKR